jgi:hypothetical protein
MAKFVNRDLEEEVKQRLKRRGLGSRIAKRFSGKGLEIGLPELSGHPARVNHRDSNK